MTCLNHRGPDGSDTYQTDNVAMGHWHFWTTPEEVGEKQPLKLPGLPFRIVLDGRLDNRTELMVELKIEPAEGSHLSDAALVLYAYDRWGEQCFERFIGDFALVLLDDKRGELLCARDALGNRSLFYILTTTRLLAASEPWALAVATDKTHDLDEKCIAYYFAMKAPENGRTFFKDVLELLPAQVLAVNQTGERRWQSWLPDFSAKIRYSSDEEYAEQFHFLLEESVHSRMRSITPVGVQMSGGLDSTSVACLIARLDVSKPITTFSYIFDEITDCDERSYIEAVKEQWGIHSIQIPCDDAWPFKDLYLCPLDKNQPAVNPFRLLKERIYQRAQHEGLRVLMTGDFADHLYGMEVGWLADLIGEGRLLEAWREISGRIKQLGLRRFWKAGSLQYSGRRLLNTLPGGIYLHRRPIAPDWLTPLSSRYIRQDKNDNGPTSILRSNISMLNIGNAQACIRENYYANCHEIELRYPYRDRRLIEFALAIPAYQFYSHGLHKRILRTAMQGILPEVIRTRSIPTPLNSLYFRGVERERKTLQGCIQNPNAIWSKFIRPDWLNKLAPDQQGREGLVRWLCIAFEIWYNSFMHTLL
jgi:asparagine synthase (glutamine-hydrolysing)